MPLVQNITSWDKFNLLEHGDHYEKLWWPKVKDDFPEWEKFWAHHVVPLTNRVDNTKTKRDRKKLLLRDDKSIDSELLEPVIMRNYSVFYYLGRAKNAIEQVHLFPEDVFIFLRAATENVEDFLGRINRLCKELHIEDSLVPKWGDIEANQTVRAIKSYREAYSHDPKLGRNPFVDHECIPKIKHLRKAKMSWTYVQNLPDECFEDSRSYLNELFTDLMILLNPVWGTTTELLDSCRTSEFYLKIYGLELPGKQ